MLQQVATVARYLSVPAVDAVWLSGSAARCQLRRVSDIDWVVVTNQQLVPAEWPSSRHSFQTYEREVFLRSLSEGREFCIWQLAYGHAIHLSDSFSEKLRRTQVAGRSIAIRRKLDTIERRTKFIRLLMDCGALDEVRRELLLLAQQQLRIEILRAGYVPGCRIEVEQQLDRVAPVRLTRWYHENRKWIGRLDAGTSDSTVMAVADHYLSAA